VFVAASSIVVSTRKHLQKLERNYWTNLLKYACENSNQIHSAQICFNGLLFLPGNSCPYAKSKHDLSSTWAKFCQLIASLFAILSQLNLTKLKLEYLKFGFKHKQEDKNKDEKFIASLEFDFFFELQLKLAFKIWLLLLISTTNIQTSVIIFFIKLYVYKVCFIIKLLFLLNWSMGTIFLHLYDL